MPKKKKKPKKTPHCCILPTFCMPTWSCDPAGPAQPDRGGALHRSSLHPRHWSGGKRRKKNRFRITGSTAEHTARPRQQKPFGKERASCSACSAKAGSRNKRGTVQGFAKALQHAERQWCGCGTHRWIRIVFGEEEYLTLQYACLLSIQT